MTRHSFPILLASTVVVLLGACNRKQSQGDKVAATPAAAPTVVASSPAKPSAPQPSLADKGADEAAAGDFASDPHKHMKAHFVRALALQEAVLAGNLTLARAEGRWLAGHDGGDIPVSWVDHIKAFQTAAKAAAEATSVEVAAVAVAQMSAACGACHAATEVAPKIGGSPVVMKARTVKAHMAAQINAMDKLWSGLAVPSEQSWNEGAKLLAEVVVPEKTLAQEKYDPSSSAVLAQTLHTLSRRALEAKPHERPTAYADLLSTCVACHTTVRREGAAPPAAAL